MVYSISSQIAQRIEAERNAGNIENEQEEQIDTSQGSASSGGNTGTGDGGNTGTGDGGNTGSGDSGSTGTGGTGGNASMSRNITAAQGDVLLRESIVPASAA